MYIVKYNEKKSKKFLFCSKKSTKKKQTNETFFVFFSYKTHINTKTTLL